MNEITTNNNIENLIYEVRGKQIMLDSDLANIYKCKNGTKSINLAVKRNINKFPKDFRFQLTKEEALLCSRFHFETLNMPKRGSNIKYLPYAYTQEGVAMLATVLNTDVASQVNINIMRAFVKMRKYLSNDLIELSYMKKQILNNSDNINKNAQDIKLLQESFAKLNAKQKINEIYFNGQIFDLIRKY